MSVEREQSERASRRAREAAGVPRLAFRVGEAAAVLGLSRDFFADVVLPELRVVRRGSVKLIPRAELERWLERSAERTIDEGGGR